MPKKTLAVGGVRLIVDQDRICASVLSGTPFEPESLKAWGDMCHQGVRALDIGAYTGLYAIMARLKHAHVIAFEPLPANRWRFQENAALNGVPWLKANAEAVSDVDGQVEIMVNPAVKGLTSGASLIRKNGAPLTVDSVRLDSLKLGKVHLMKIDVERAEPLVLSGGKKMIARDKPIILIEVLDREREVAVLEALAPMGYRREAELDGRNWLMVPK